MLEDLFSLNLTEEGSNSLLRFYHMARTIFIGSIVWSVITIISVLVSISHLSRTLGDTGHRIIMQLMPYYIYSSLIIILIPFQGYFYFAFSKKMKRSIADKNSAAFNSSFRLLNTNAVLTLVALLINFLYVAYNLYSILNRKQF
jgi:hypothetical protein